MIINIRGTSGSGKTWAMREIKRRIVGDHRWSEYYIPGRNKPAAYYYRVTEDELIIVLGHYESNCGGCDNVGSAPDVYNLIDHIESHDDLFKPVKQFTILCEGLLLSEDVKWTTKLAERHKVVCLFLNTPIEQCINQVLSRRRAAGNEKPLNENNTRKRVAVIERAERKLVAVKGVSCYRCSAEQAVRRALNCVNSVGVK